MFRIDFMGTPGIGKTHLIASILAKKTSGYIILSRGDALIKIARKNSSQYSLLYKALMQVGSIFPKSDALLLLANVINRKKEDEIFSERPYLDPIIDEALLQYKEFSQPALRKIKRVLGLYQQIIDGILISSDDSRQIVLMDESLAQHMPDVDFLAYSGQPLYPHLLVHVSGNVDGLIKHIRDREKKRKKNPKKLDHEYLKQSLDYYTERAKRFRAAGVEVIHVDISNPLSDNIDKIMAGIIHTIASREINDSINIEN